MTELVTSYLAERVARAIVAKDLSIRVRNIVTTRIRVESSDPPIVEGEVPEQSDEGDAESPRNDPVPENDPEIEGDTEGEPA